MNTGKGCLGVGGCVGDWVGVSDGGGRAFKKIDKKVPKKGTKKSTYLLKKLKFCMKN